MSTSPDSARIVVGRIVGAHGIKGVLRIHPLTDYPERFLDMEALHLETPGKPPRELDVLEISSHDGKKQYLVSVSGITTREEADALRGYVVTVSPEERVPLADGEYWIDSLIGLDVVDAESDTHLGKIEDVLQTGSNDVYQVRTPDGALKMVPAIAQIVQSIDPDAGCMKIVVMEGLWD